MYLNENRQVKNLSRESLENLITFLVDIVQDDSLNKTGQLVKIKKLLEFYKLL